MMGRMGLYVLKGRKVRRVLVARACLAALLEWFRDETEARAITLNVTPDGIALYRSVGFTVPRFAALQLILAEPLVM